MDSIQPTWAEVDLGALKRNYERIKAHANSDIMPIVKADAYGHGAMKIVEPLKGMGAKSFGVATLDEALELKEAFPDISIMMIGSMLLPMASTIVKEDITASVYDLEQATVLSKAATNLGKVAKIHIKVDTGMGRIGFREDEFVKILRVTRLPNIQVEGIFTHFASADSLDLTFTYKQLEVFNKIYDKLKAEGVVIPIRHAANSAAILQLPEANFEMVRAGITLYGLPPSRFVGRDEGFEPVLSWKTKVTHLKTIQKGETVSYGQTFQAAYPTKVATLSVGYADGLRRTLSNSGEVLIKGNRATIIGRVCMDQIMIDVTKIPGVKIGDTVTLLGSDGYERIDATEMAEWLDTINYEIVCGISKRVKRIYID